MLRKLEHSRATKSLPALFGSRSYFLTSPSGHLLPRCVHPPVSTRSTLPRLGTASTIPLRGYASQPPGSGGSNGGKGFPGFSFSMAPQKGEVLKEYVSNARVSEVLFEADWHELRRIVESRAST